MVIDQKTTKKFALYMEKYHKLYYNLAKIILNDLPESISNSRIVDIGTGPGLLLTEIHQLIPDAILLGIDPSIDMLEMAKKHMSNYSPETYASIIIGSSEKIPLKDNTVDIIVSRFSLIYWKKPEKSIMDIYKILKPRGRVIFEVLNRDYPSWKLFLTKIHMYLNSAGKNVIKYHFDAYKIAFNIEQLERILKKNNFKIIKKIGKKKYWKFTIIAEKNI